VTAQVTLTVKVAARPGLSGPQHDRSCFDGAVRRGCHISRPPLTEMTLPVM
jgi:hypothetical protein